MRVEGEKPYNAWANLRRDPSTRKKVAQLLDYLTGQAKDLPSKTLRWDDISRLEDAVTL
jgi:hypothetical protein